MKESIDSPMAVPIMATALPYWMTSLVSFFMLQNYCHRRRSEKTKNDHNFAAKMTTINSIEASYRLYLSRLSKQSTRKDYTMRFNVFLAWCSMERIDRLEEFNLPQFLDYVFLVGKRNTSGLLLGKAKRLYAQPCL